MFPRAIQFGMTPYQFWHEDIGLFNTYQVAYLQNKSYESYLIGARVYQATSLVISATLGSKNKGYPKEPPDIINELIKKSNNKKQQNLANKLREMNNYWK